LYISEYYLNKISKIDLTSPSPTIINVVTGLNGPYGIALNGNNLYIAEYFSNKISKVDISVSNPTVQNVITNLSGPSSLAFKGNELYFTESNANKISKINVTDSLTINTLVLNGLSTPMGITFNGNDLYICEYNANKISKFVIDNLSLNDNLSITNSQMLYPNPSKDFIIIKGIDKDANYTIFDNLGKMINSGVVSENKKIEIKNLMNGLYFLRVDNGQTFKFIKE